MTDGNVYDDIEKDLLEQRVLFIEEEFNEESINVLKRELMYCMTHNPKKPVTIYISSYGGDCYDFLTLYGLLKKRKFKLTTIALGKCMSAGAFLLLLGDNRIAFDGSRIMFHELSYETNYSKLNDQEIDFNESKILQSFLNKIVIEKTKIKKPEVWLEKDRFISRKEALDLGILTELD